MVYWFHSRTIMKCLLYSRHRHTCDNLLCYHVWKRFKYVLVALVKRTFPRPKFELFFSRQKRVLQVITEIDCDTQILSIHALQTVSRNEKLWAEGSVNYKQTGKLPKRFLWEWRKVKWSVEASLEMRHMSELQALLVRLGSVQEEHLKCGGKISRFLIGKMPENAFLFVHSFFSRVVK